MSSFISPSEKTMVLWAKSDRGKESDAWHPLLCHLLDVAASCLEILELEPVGCLRLFAKDTKTSPEEAVSITAALVGLHDIGKANPGFQLKSESCATRVEAAGFPMPRNREIPHGVVSQAILIDLLRSELGMGRAAANLLADAVGAHHGFRSEAEPLNRARSERRAADEEWIVSQQELFWAVWDTLGAPGSLPLKRISAQSFQWLMGLTSVADWIGSSLEFTEFRGDPKQYLAGARARARNRLRQLGWNKKGRLTELEDFADLFEFIGKGAFRFQPRPLQQAVVDLLRDIEEPVLLIVEAPMGEGKTEASFYAHVRLQQELNHRGAYVGLPSQATGNAMFERLRDFLKGQGREEPPDLQLLHGAAILSESYQELQNYASNLGEVDEQAVVARSYFTHLKRALLSEYGAGTIDQALLSVLPVKHHFVRLWGLANRTLILDEVHAYDAYTGELLNELISWMKALGSSVILMSATLPNKTRKAMLEAFGCEEELETGPYPRVTRVHDGSAASVTFESRPLVSFELHSSPIDISSMAEHARQTVRDGGCLCCIVNTVDRAQKLYREIRDAAPELELQLFHARFPIDQKQQLESEVLRLYGKGNQAERNPQRPKRAVLVATQVVEQSLDLDFDVMMTDLAPVDLILQRAGRLHRHSKNHGHRGVHEQARLLVAGLNSKNIVEDWEPTYWQKIYSPDILLRSWLVLQKPSVDLGVDLDPLVQKVYDEDHTLPGQNAFTSLLKLWRSDSKAQTQGDRLEARQVNIGHPRSTDWKMPGRHEFGDQDELNLVTRKAEPTVVVVPVYQEGNRYYLDRERTTPVSQNQNPATTQAKQIYEKTIKISRQSVVHKLIKTGEKPWTKSGLLRDVIILPIEGNCCRIGRTILTLCPERGLVYEIGENS